MTHFPHGKQPPARISFLFFSPPPGLRLSGVLKVKTTFSFISWVLLQIFCLKYLNLWCRKPFKFFLNRDQFRESLIICLPHRKWKMQTTKVKCIAISQKGSKSWFCFHCSDSCSLPPSSCWEKTGTCFYPQHSNRKNETRNFSNWSKVTQQSRGCDSKKLSSSN